MHLKGRRCSHLSYLFWYYLSGHLITRRLLLLPLLRFHPLVKLSQRIQLSANTNIVVSRYRKCDLLTNYSRRRLPSSCGEPAPSPADCCHPPWLPLLVCSPAAAGGAAPPSPAPVGVSSSGEARRHVPAPPSRPPPAASPLGPLWRQIPRGYLKEMTAGKQTFDSICFYCLSVCAFTILQLLSPNNLGNSVCPPCRQAKIYLDLKWDTSKVKWCGWLLF